MALEASDLNDGTILQQTKQITDARGNIQFSIELPSKRVLKSEFMAKDSAREALKKWLEVVKEQAVADSNAERLERAAKARRGSIDVERRPGDDQPLFRAGGARVKDELEATLDAGTPVSPEPEYAKEPLSNALLAGKTDEVDPLDFALQQRKIHAERVASLKDAERKLWQWSTIVETLESNDA